ncbi:MAG TPA: hypothetical protein VIY47_03770, partial [Ignavibacteriaceae bacterium]
MFSKTFKQFNSDDDFVATSPFWRSMLEQHVTSSSFDYRTNAKNRIAIYTALKGLESMIFMVENHCIKEFETDIGHKTQFTGGVSQSYENFNRRRYVSFFDGQKDMLSHFDPSDLLPIYSNLLIVSKDDWPSCHGNKEILGDFSRSIAFNPISLNFFAMYLMASSFENID